jgi:membrane protein DedA with SNARE-associated domain
MVLLDWIVATGIDLIIAYGLLGMFLFAFLETSMLFPYLPAEVVVPLAAATLVTDSLSIVLFTVSTTLGGTLGALVAYSVTVKGGRLAKTRLESHLRLSEKRTERAHRWYLKWGQPSVIWGRLLPGLRSIVSVPAAIAGMPWQKFTLYTTIGNAAFYASVAILVRHTQISSFRSVGTDVLSGSAEFVPRIGVVLALTVVAWWLTDRHFA